MPVAFLCVTLIGALAVLLAYRPIRREPFTVVSFTMAWIAGELAFQNILWQMVATALFIWAGALTSWVGWVGLVVAVLDWIGLIGLGVVGQRTGLVTAAALDEVRTPAFPVPDMPTAATWGKWWRVSRGIPLRSRTVEPVRDVAYCDNHQARHRLDIYRPRLPAPHGAPVMVYVHGGAWVIGDKREQGKPMMFELVARGWVCVAVNYRLSPRATWPDHLVDVKRALVWVKEHIAEYGGDPSFVALSGGSAGGHLCALMALTAGDPAFQPGFEGADTSVDACIPFYGVMDLTGSPDGSAIFGRGLLRLLERSVMKTKESAHPEVFRDASPTYRVNVGAPPFFVLQGANDTLVPVETARRFVERLRSVSRQPVAYAELPLAQHAFDVLASLRCQATTSAVADFLEGARAAAVLPGDRMRSSARPLSDVQSAVSDVESAPEF